MALFFQRFARGACYVALLASANAIARPVQACAGETGQAATCAEVIRVSALEDNLRAQRMREDQMRQDALRREAMRRDTLRHEALRRDALRQEGLRRDALRQEALRRDALRQQALQDERTREALMREKRQRERRSHPHRCPPGTQAASDPRCQGPTPLDMQ